MASAPHPVPLWGTAQAGGSSGSTACNNLTRSLLVAGGVSQTTIQCGQWSLTVNIAGQALQINSPAACVSSMTTRSGDTFACGPSADKIHCKTNADQITVKVRTNPNPCPGIPATLPSTLANARNAMQCGALSDEAPEVNNSAGISNCTTGTGGGWHLEGSVVSASDTYTVTYLDPAPLLSPPVLDEMFLQLEVLQTDPLASLPDPLRLASNAHPKLAGVGRLHATVTFEFPQSESEVETKDSYRIEGRVAGDGRFSISKSFSAKGEGGAVVPLTEDLVFDGASFFSYLRGSSNGNAWAATSPAQRMIRANEAACVRPLLDWVYNPYWITRFPGAHRTVSLEGAEAVVTESHPGAFGPDVPSGTTVYRIALEPVAHPVAVETRTGYGELLVRREYSDHRKLSAGVWRPFGIVEKFYSATAAEPWLVVTTTIRAAAELTESQLSSFQRPVMSQDCWFVRN